jgi:hypothetical protein
MNRFSAGLKSSSPLLKQGAPTNLSVKRSLAPVLTQTLKPNLVLYFVRSDPLFQHFLDRIDFKLRLLMAAGGGACVWRQSEAIEDGSQHQDRHEQDSEMEVAQLRHSC